MTAAPSQSVSPAVSGRSDRPGGRTAGGQTPERSLKQRLDALERANAVRSARAGFKRVLGAAAALRARELAAELIVSGPAPEFETMHVFELLMAVPKLGQVKVNRMLIAARVSPSKTLHGLSERQRHTLACLLTGTTDSGQRT